MLLDSTRGVAILDCLVFMNLTSAYTEKNNERVYALASNRGYNSTSRLNPLLFSLRSVGTLLSAGYTLPVVTTTPPSVTKWASVIAIVQSLLGLAYAVFLVIRQFSGKEDPSLVITGDSGTAHYVGLGTAIFLFIVFGAVVAGGIFLIRGHLWGRGPVVVLEMMLVLISFYMFRGGMVIFGAATIISAGASLAFMFSKSSVDWAAEQRG